MPIAFLLPSSPHQRESKVVFSLSLSSIIAQGEKKNIRASNIFNYCKGIETEFPVMQMNPCKPFEMSVSDR